MNDKYESADTHRDDDHDPEEQDNGTLLIRAAQLEIHWPDGRVEKRNLDQAVVQIGREVEDGDIGLPRELESISRKHFEIRREGYSFHVVDLDSVNGVFINGDRVSDPIELHDGDEITIGLADLGDQVRMVFHAGTLSELSAGQPEPDPIELVAEPDREIEIDGPSVRIRFTGAGESVVPLTKDVSLIGRSEDAEVRLPASLRYVSNKHAEIRRVDGAYTITDLNSTNGTRLNGQMLEPGDPAPIRDGALLRIGDDAVGISVGITFINPGEQLLPVSGFSPAAREPTRKIETGRVIIGRALDSDVILDSPQVSRHHAAIERFGETYQLVDLNSLNGTFLNDQRVSSAELEDGDLIRIESHLLLFQDGKVTKFDSQGMRVDVTGLTQEISTRSGSLRILDGITFSILPREFVALVGASGSGKTTLMKGLIGTWPANGEVRLNGYNLYEEYDRFRSQLGYVPQADILHTTLTVERALDYAARLRLPADISKDERARRITSVLETVGMDTEVLRSTRINRLSGGQRKRVSIAAELLADPKLFFLDEATSGLDPGLEKKMMYTLRRMADEGRTIVLITHATANIVQVDHVIFLAEGKRVYFGPPQDSLDFFDVGEFADIYERIKGRGSEWRQVYEGGKSGLYEQYVDERQKRRLVQHVQHATGSVRFGFGKFLRQFGVLFQRTLDVLTSDVLTLGLLLLLFPLTAMLQLVIATPEILTGNPAILADPVRAAADLTQSYVPFPDLNTFVFVMGLEAVLVGMYVPSNELIKERSIYLRERMVNLGLPPYLLSKVAVFTLFAALQCVLYLVVLSLGVDFPDDGLFMPFELEVFITLFLTMMAGIGIGLLVSSISRSTDMAIYMLVILLFFQFFFAGTVFDLRDRAAEPLSYMTTTRWSLLALGVTIDMESQTEATILCSTLDDPRTPQVEEQTVCENHPEATEDLMLPYEDRALAQSWAILAGTCVLFVAAAGAVIKRLDTT